MVEAAIVLPLVLAVLFAFVDLVRVLTYHITIRELHYAAGRLAAQQQVGCFERAVQTFERKIKSAAITPAGQNPVVSSIPSDMMSAASGGIAGMRFPVQVNIECILCRIIPGLRERVQYRSSIFIPYENGNCS